MDGRGGEDGWSCLKLQSRGISLLSCSNPTLSVTSLSTSHGKTCPATTSQQSFVEPFNRDSDALTSELYGHNYSKLFACYENLSRCILSFNLWLFLIVSPFACSSYALTFVILDTLIVYLTYLLTYLLTRKPVHFLCFCSYVKTSATPCW